MNQSMRLKRIVSLLVWLWCLWVPVATAQQAVLHQGPSLRVVVQRGQDRLPLRLVPQLKAGDTVWVEPLAEKLAPGDWVLMLASTSPTGTHVRAQFHDVRSLQGPARFEVAADGLALVVVLAPQLRNLFGLNTSMHESSTILKDVLTKDPQRFIDLQRVDQINQAITLIGQSLDRRIQGQSPAQAKQITIEWASQYGLNPIDPQCFQPGGVNAVCVAHAMVLGNQFSLPSTNDLSSMVGLSKNVDLNSLLTANLKFFSDAGEYLSSKYRDTYDFAPTYGQRDPSSDQIDLYSVARLRHGKVKTAYIFVPYWFTGAAPRFQFNPLSSHCLKGGVLPVRALDPLPLMDHWHQWSVHLHHADSSSSLAQAKRVMFNADEPSLIHDWVDQDLKQLGSVGKLRLAIRARFGFDEVSLPSVDIHLPLTGPEQVRAQLQGLDDLVAGGVARMQFSSPAIAACVQKIALKRPGVDIDSREGPFLSPWDIALKEVPAGPVVVEVTQAGMPPLVLDQLVHSPPSLVSRIEHHKGEPWVLVKGQGLDQLKSIRVGPVQCLPAKGERLKQSQWRFDCPDASDGDLMLESATPEQANHRWPSLAQRLFQLPALPRVVVSRQVRNAVLAVPSFKFKQWNLSLDANWVSDDSGLSLLLQAVAPYRLRQGVHELQARFSQDPLSDQQPIKAPLITDLAHNELRTRAPLRFDASRLPGVVNPIEYRVVNLTTGEQSNWEPLGKSVLLLPLLKAHSCIHDTQELLIQGEGLDRIDEWTLINTNAPDAVLRVPSRLVACEAGLCQRLPSMPGMNRVEVSLRWVQSERFLVNLPAPDESCARTLLNERDPPARDVPRADPQ